MDVLVPVALESVTGRIPSADELDALLDEVMDALIEPDGYDIDYTALINLGKVTFTAFSDDDVNPDFNAVFGAVRAALHSAGVATPGWENDQALWVANMNRIEFTRDHDRELIPA